MAKNNKVRIAVELELDDQDFAVLNEAAPKDAVGAFIKACAEEYLHEYANGGLMLNGQEVAQVSKISKTKVASSADVIGLIEASQKVSKGQKMMQVPLDPTLLDSFRQNADMLGLSLDEFIADCWNHIHANGWLYQMQSDVHWVALSPELYEAIKKATKSGFVTSHQISEILKGEKEKVAA